MSASRAREQERERLVAMAYTLYKGTSAWGLPSYSAASIQVEAYLRLAKVELAAEACSNAGTSPSGQLPALEDPGGAVVSSSSGGEFEAARSLLEALRERSVDLDKRLSATQRAESLAFAALIQNRLEPATTYTNWCEWESFSKHMRAIAGADLAAPLNYLIPWTQRRATAKQFADTTREEVYSGAAECYEALAAHLGAVEGDYFLGSQPSSVDALLYGHLALHLSAPTTAPELRAAVESHAVLKAYADRISAVFASPLPPAPPPSTSQEWASRAEASSSGSRAKKAKKLTKQEQEHRRRNWIWLGCAATTLVLYVLVSGQVLEISYNLGYEEEEEAEEDQ